MITRTWRALGTTAVLVLADAGPHAVTEAAADAAQAALVAELDAVDRAASRFRPDSELAGLARAAGRRVAISALLHDAIALALQAAQETGGAVDPTLGPELVALGYDRDLDALRRVDAATPGAENPAGPARTPHWEEIELFDDPPAVRIPRGVGLDLGATAKALAADRSAIAAHRATGVGVLVALGGDIAIAGDPPDGGWPVRVCEDHRQTGDAGQLVRIRDGGLATSSVTTRRWSNAGQVHHHILDPATGTSITGCWRTASVLAATCAGANTATTAALVLGDRARSWLQERRLPARLVSRSGEVHTLGGWPA